MFSQNETNLNKINFKLIQILVKIESNFIRFETNRNQIYKQNETNLNKMNFKLIQILSDLRQNRNQILKQNETNLNKMNFKLIQISVKIEPNFIRFETKSKSNFKTK